VPTVEKKMVHIVWPEPFSGILLQSVVVLSLKVTVPSFTTLPDTVAIRTTGSPKTEYEFDEATVVAVSAGFTVNPECAVKVC
jgi:hypothetical protein